MSLVLAPRQIERKVKRRNVDSLFCSRSSVWASIKRRYQGQGSAALRTVLRLRHRVFLPPHSSRTGFPRTPAWAVGAISEKLRFSLNIVNWLTMEDIPVKWVHALTFKWCDTASETDWVGRVLQIPEFRPLTNKKCAVIIALFPIRFKVWKWYERAWQANFSIIFFKNWKLLGATSDNIWCNCWTSSARWIGSLSV